MKRIYGMFGVFVLVLAMTGAAWAAETKDEKSLNTEATEIDTTAKNAQGEKIVVGRLEKEFNVTDTQIQGLRDKKLGYGEISIVLSLSQTMPGGITDANIQQIMTLRQGPPIMGWGEIAKKLGTKLGTTVSQVKKVNKDTGREMKSEAKGEKGKMDMHGDHDAHGGMADHEGIGGAGASHGRGR